jgi:hypothetical protein
VSTPERAAEHTDDPQLSAGTPFGDDDQTAESYPGLPAQARPEAPALSFKHLRHLRLPVGAAWAMSGAVLIAVGVILGTTLSGGGSTGTAFPPPPDSGTATGPVCPTSTTLPASATLCVTPASGTPQTVFAIHGSDLTPDVKLTLRFYPPPQSKQSPTVVTEHVHNPIMLASLQLGMYQLVASLPSGRTATVVFVVIPPGFPPPAAQAPPTAQAHAPPPTQPANLRTRPPQILLPGAPGRIGKPPQVRGGDDTVLDQRPDGHLVR